MTSIVGIQNIDPNTIVSDVNYIKDLEIFSNPKLSECEVQSICNFLDLPDKTKEIHDNKEGCNNEWEIQDACTNGISESSTPESISIYPNPTREDFIIDFTGTEVERAKVNIYSV